VTRRVRDREAERGAISAATDRLLAGTPLRSTSGKLTSSELITESSLRRDVVYGDHKDLVDQFHARVKAQHTIPAAVAKIAEHNQALHQENTKLKAAFAAERARNKTLTKIAVELSLELEQATEELAQVRQIPRLTPLQPITPA
jgi:hypothetical protein